MTAPHQYIALLRGINVGGKSSMKMDDLRAQFEALGLTNVRTHIQTGNVLFKTADSDIGDLARRIEKQLAAGLSYEGSVFVLTSAQLKGAAANNPFDPERRDQEQRCHLMFLSDAPAADRVRALTELAGKEYQFAVKGKVFYYAYPRAFEGSKRRSIDFEKVLGVSGTARTWKVVNKLIGLTK